jgi:uncharacterized protein YydD (DUF2326 family)
LIVFAALLYVCNNCLDEISSRVGEMGTGWFFNRDKASLDIFRFSEESLEEFENLLDPISEQWFKRSNVRCSRNSVVNTSHYGINQGKVPAEIVVFYAGVVDTR